MDSWYQAFMGLAPKQIPHWEHWSCPDAETYMSGIDHYEHPKLCREKLAELYPQLKLEIPAEDKPIPRPETVDLGEDSGEEHKHRVRWGDSFTWQWDWGHTFKTAEDALKFSPLAQGDFTDIPVVESRDYRDEEKLYPMWRQCFPSGWGDKAPEGSSALVSFYNTMFMWPLLTFGWELFLEICLDERFERIMDEFAEINRRVFRTFAKLPVNFIVCHDDIVNSKGPICSPAWMKKYIFPRYEEFWSIVKAAGKEVIFMVDGCIDTYADDIFACGARGIISEPYTDWRTIARKHENCFIAGEGDNRILMRNDKSEIRAMVEQMVETSKMTDGYMMCIGNHIPWNIPPEAVKYYFDLSAELAVR
ncbi:MAG: uroporphyrinogen decarboxylase family protein [Armatimonadota bacterium]